MILVFSFLGLLSLYSIIFIVFLMSTLKIKIDKMRIENFENDKKYKILFQVFFLNKIKILSIKIDNDKINKIQQSKRLRKINLKHIEEAVPTKKEVLNILKKINPKIEYLNLKIQIGLDDAVITAYIVGIIGAIISILLPKTVNNIYNKNKARKVNKISNKKIKYQIIPAYNQKTFDVYLESIINIKIVHIIFVIYTLLKKGRNKNGRASNRRTYAYSHEFN